MFEDDARSAGETGLQEKNAHGEAIPEVTAVGTHTRYRGKAMSWLALGALLAAWHAPRADRPTDNQSRHGAARGAQNHEQLWLARASQARTWIERAPHGVTAAVVPTAAQPDFSALASVRTARRWLRNF